jgi:hypothetical protein
MTLTRRTSPLLLPGLIACVSFVVAVISFASWAIRYGDASTRFSKWESASALPPGEALVWSALLIATNEKEPSRAPSELRRLEDRMRRVFGYNQFKVIEEAENRVSKQGERWFVPTEQMYLGMRLLGDPKQDRQAVNLKIWRKNQLLVDADATIRPGSPLFVRGPLKGRGQLIFVIMLARLPQVAKS